MIGIRDHDRPDRVITLAGMRAVSRGLHERGPEVLTRSSEDPSFPSRHVLTMG
jgi:hypothetical protein